MNNVAFFETVLAENQKYEDPFQRILDAYNNENFLTEYMNSNHGLVRNMRRKAHLKTAQMFKNKRSIKSVHDYLTSKQIKKSFVKAEKLAKERQERNAIEEAKRAVARGEVPDAPW